MSKEFVVSFFYLLLSHPTKKIMNISAVCCGKLLFVQANYDLFGEFSFPCVSMWLVIRRIDDLTTFALTLLYTAHILSICTCGSLMVLCT